MAKTSDNLTEEEKVKILRDRANERKKIMDERRQVLKKEVEKELDLKNAISKTMNTIEKVIHAQSGVWNIVGMYLAQQLNIPKEIKTQLLANLTNQSELSSNAQLNPPTTSNSSASIDDTMNEKQDTAVNEIEKQKSAQQCTIEKMIRRISLS